MATDEGILFKSLPGQAVRTDLYRPYRARFQGAEVSMVFRDRNLSDLIGFTYSRNPAASSVEDLLNHLRNIRGALPAKEEALVVIALDGENAWEYYPDGGLEFIRGLYRRLSGDDALVSTTFRSYLDRHPATAAVHEIFTGSWINNNFAIWIGHREDNRAWDLLSEAREALVSAEVKGSVSADRLKDAWEELYMAEGSDWCWWYGDDHTSGNDDVFDELYRRHLMNLYELIGEKPPEGVLTSILESAGGLGPATEEVPALISPRIDGLVSSYFEWLGATSHEIHRRGQTMHRTDVPVSHFHYGVSLEHLFLRVDFRAGYHDPQLIGDALVVHVAKPRQLQIVIPLSAGGRGALIVDEQSGARRDLPDGSAAIDEILEAGVLWKDLGVTVNEQVRFHLSLEKAGSVLTSWPMSGSFSVVVPGADFERRMWSV
jgi:hypothetical protein